jgi:hypothetical protein
MNVCICLMIDGRHPVDMHPWYRGFQVSIYMNIYMWIYLWPCKYVGM